MRIEQMVQIQSVIDTARAYIHTEYVICEKDLGSDHFVTKSRKKDLDIAENAYKSISEEIRDYWFRKYTCEETERKVTENDA